MQKDKKNIIIPALRVNLPQLHALDSNPKREHCIIDVLKRKINDKEFFDITFNHPKQGSVEFILTREQWQELSLLISDFIDIIHYLK